MTKKEFNTVIAVTLLLIILILIGIVFTVVYKFRAPAITVEPQPKAAEVTVTGLKIPPVVYVYNGVVQKVGQDYLLVAARSHNNYLAKDVVLKVLTDPQTEFKKRIFPGNISEETTIITTSEKLLKFSDIKIGDLVEVHSEQNIRGLVDFTASQVKVLAL